MSLIVHMEKELHIKKVVKLVYKLVLGVLIFSKSKMTRCTAVIQNFKVMCLIQRKETATLVH